MRKIYLLAPILFFSINIVNAQIDKGQKLLMGNIALSIGKSEDDTLSNWYTRLIKNGCQILH
jgi:hypothetical protein